MKEKIDNIDIYNNSAIILYRKIPPKIISWITILIILLVLFIIFSFVPFNVYKPSTGYVKVESDESYLILNSDLPISKNYKLYIKNKLYDYEIIDIIDGQVILKLSLDDDLKIDKNIIRVNILKDRTTIFNIIKNKIKKGFDL